MKQEFDLSIITLTYNSEKTIEVLLDSIKKSPDKLSKEVIVVDNNSADKSVEVASSHPLKPSVMKMPGNIGFSRAVNRAIEASSGKYILLINPDTKIIGSALDKLYHFAESKTTLGAVAPQLVSPDGKPQASVFHFPTVANAIKKDFLGRKQAFGKYLPSKKIQTVDVAVFAAFLVPRSVFSLIGLLDERFFLYYEDIEFCRRLNTHHLPLYYFPEAKVMHVHGASGHFVSHQQSPLLASARIYYGAFYANVLNSVLWLGHKWQVILRRKRFRD